MRKMFLECERWMLFYPTDGNYANQGEARMAVEAAGFIIGNTASRILKACAFGVDQGELAVHLVRVTPRDLGFLEKPLIVEFYERVVTAGLSFLPRHWAPALRLQYHAADEPENQWCVMGMMPFLHFYDHFSLFAMRKEDGKSYLTTIGGPAISKRLELDDLVVLARQIQLLNGGIRTSAKLVAKP